MNRRSFLASLPATAAAVAAIPSRGELFAQEVKQGAFGSPYMDPPNDAFDIPYFTRDVLEKFVDTSASLSGMSFQTVAYNFPNYHPSPAQERFLGKGWTEWELMKRAKPVFEGHLSPKYPLWGFYDESEPLWAEREIETASRYGIDAFMIDWYWYDGVQILHEQLEKGFLRARNTMKMQFAIMWANLDWNNQYPAPLSAQGKYDLCPALYTQTYSLRDMDRIVDYWCEHYLREPNYLKIQGVPVVGIFDVKHLLKSFEPKQLRKVLDGMRTRAAKEGINGIHFQASQTYEPGKTPIKEVGFDSATSYHTYGNAEPGKTSEWIEGAKKTIDHWKLCASSLDVPYFPDCPVGWDQTSRYGAGGHVFIHRTPDQYEILLLGAKHFLANTGAKPSIVFLSSWNEWSEDHVLAPDAFYGYGYLEAVRRQFGIRVPG